MIRIERCACPESLQSTTARYNSKQVVTALWKMQKKKCCYCEDIIPESGHQKAVDHFQPKSVFKDRKTDWDNLLLACAQCNGIKSDRFPVILSKDKNDFKVVYLKKATKRFEQLLIDPSSEDPEKYLDFEIDNKDVNIYAMIKAKRNMQKGNVTIETIGLDQDYYTKKHYSFLIDILVPLHLRLMRALGQGSDFQGYAEELRQYMSSDYAFAALSRAFARFKRLNKKPFYIPIPKGSS